jgi:hypothetical protein
VKDARTEVKVTSLYGGMLIAEEDNLQFNDPSHIIAPPSTLLSTQPDNERWRNRYGVVFTLRFMARASECKFWYCVEHLPGYALLSINVLHLHKRLA